MLSWVLSHFCHDVYFTSMSCLYLCWCLTSWCKATYSCYEKDWDRSPKLLWEVFVNRRNRRPQELNVPSIKYSFSWNWVQWWTKSRCGARCCAMATSKKGKAERSSNFSMKKLFSVPLKLEVISVAPVLFCDGLLVQVCPVSEKERCQNCRRCKIQAHGKW